MEANEALGQPQPVRLPRTERKRARIEDFEMIAQTRQALALLDAKWSVDIIFLLATGMRRHARLVDNIPGISKKVLTATLRKLEQNGIVARQVYAEIPVRVEYTLTRLGWELTEPLMALYEWSVAHESELAASKQNTENRAESIRPAALSLAPAAAA
jgi:DNA-binding HxlR family transcriptional regulator